MAAGWAGLENAGDESARRSVTDVTLAPNTTRRDVTPELAMGKVSGAEMRYVPAPGGDGRGGGGVDGEPVRPPACTTRSGQSTATWVVVHLPHPTPPLSPGGKTMSWYPTDALNAACEGRGDRAAAPFSHPPPRPPPRPPARHLDGGRVVRLAVPLCAAVGQRRILHAQLVHARGQGPLRHHTTVPRPHGGSSSRGRHAGCCDDAHGLRGRHAGECWPTRCKLDAGGRGGGG
jgi:hypothetical protein